MSGTATVGCPGWCTVQHGQLLGEDDLVHCSAEILIGDLVLRLCVDSATGHSEGPYVLVGDHELTAREAERLIQALTELAGLASSVDHRVSESGPAPVTPP